MQKYIIQLGRKKFILRVWSLMPEQSQDKNYTKEINVSPMMYTNFFYLGFKRWTIRTGFRTKLVRLLASGPHQPRKKLQNKNFKQKCNKIFSLICWFIWLENRRNRSDGYAYIITDEMMYNKGNLKSRVDR